MTVTIYENYLGHKLKFPAVLSDGGLWLNSRKGVSKGRKCKNGYRQFNFTLINGKQENVYVHRTIYFAFNQCGDKKLVIDHVNHNREDNRLCNLRLVTVRTNVLNSSATKVQNEVIGFWLRAQHKYTSLTLQQVADLFAHKTGRSLRVLQVYRICKGVSRREEHEKWLSLSETEQREYLNII